MIVIVLGGSGSGKKNFKTLCGNYGLNVLQSVTTKPKFNAEEEKFYKFVSKDQFDKLIKNDELLEWTEAFNYQYGTLRRDFTKNCVTTVDPKSLYKLKNIYRDKVFAVYFDISKELRKEILLIRGFSSEDIDEIIIQDDKTLQNLNKSIVNLTITDKDINNFDQIINNHSKTWVVR